MHDYTSSINAENIILYVTALLRAFNVDICGDFALLRSSEATNPQIEWLWLSMDANLILIDDFSVSNPIFIAISNAFCAKISASI